MMMFQVLAILPFVLGALSSAVHGAEPFGGTAGEVLALTGKAKTVGTVRARMDPACILQAMIYKVNLVAVPEGMTYIRFDPNKPVPRIRYASEVPLTEFQDAIEKQWGQRPEFVTNSYVPEEDPAQDTIFLKDNASYYLRVGRRIEDSLAHEFQHYLQYRYQRMSMPEIGEWGEMDAVYAQNWFRENYIEQAPPAGAPVCPAS